MPKEISIVIPVFNEKSGLAETVRGIYQAMKETDFVFELILIDDGSTDGTGELIKGLELPNLKKICHQQNKGYGASLKSGIRSARYSIIAITDADGTYPNERIPEFASNMDGFDMVIGARTGKQKHIPWVKRFAKSCLIVLANYLTASKIPDLNSGFRVMKKEVVENFFHLLPNGFSFTSTITLAMLSDGYQVKYVPINYSRRKGLSKFKAIRDTFNFFLLIIRTVLYFNPLRFFVPLGMIFFGLSILTILYRFYHSGGLGVVTLILFVAAIQTLAIGMLADLITRKIK